MNRKDLPLFIALIALLLAWPTIDRRIVRPLFPERAAPPPAPGPEGGEPVPPALEAPGGTAAGAAEDPLPAAAPPRSAEAVPPEVEPPARGPARTVTLRNDRLELTLSARGAAVESARVLDYLRTRDPSSGPVTLDFSSAPALAYEDVPGLGAGYDFDLEEIHPGREVRFVRASASGRRLERTYRLGDAYLVEVSDVWTPPAGEGLAVPAHGLRTGTMRNLPGETAMRGIAYLAIDTLSPGGGKVRHWGKKVPRLFKEAQGEAGGGRPPVSIRRPLPLDGPADWVAAKSKYFVQLLRPGAAAREVEVEARREVTEREASDPRAKPRVTAEEIAAVLRFDAVPAPAPGGSVTREWHYYLGPKKYSELSGLAYHQADVMEFGMWAPIGKVLLKILNGIHRVLPNYGIAIMLLTILIRVIFWPVTHKSTQSMKRMQEMQPLVAAIRAKFKDNPQRQQKEIMALYKEHKVNPVGGCLPMIIQIPVFIALFVVLRSAIELRFAPFLWVRDLSEPENLLAGVLPLPLNILPLVMTGMQFLQQKLSPQAGDPQQQKMMAFMPMIMLVFFYNFASGLVLYWTTNTALMVVQQVLQRRHASRGTKAG